MDYQFQDGQPVPQEQLGFYDSYEQNTNKLQSQMYTQQPHVHQAPLYQINLNQDQLYSDVKQSPNGLNPQNSNKIDQTMSIHHYQTQALNNQQIIPTIMPQGDTSEIQFPTDNLQMFSNTQQTRSNLLDERPDSQSRSGDGSRDRSRSDNSNISARLKEGYPDEASRESSKMKWSDHPLKKSRDYSKALSIFSMRRESSKSSERRSSNLPQARFVQKKKKVDMSRINDKQLRVASPTPTSSEGPVNDQQIANATRCQTNPEMSRQNGKESDSRATSQQILDRVNQSFSHDSFGQNPANYPENLLPNQRNTMQGQRQMIQVYSRNQKLNVHQTDTKAKRASHATQNGPEGFQKNQQPRNQIGNVTQSENFQHSPLYLPRGGPGITTSQENRPRGRRVDSNVDSVQSPDSRPTSTAPILQSRGDGSSRNGGKEGPRFDEDCTNVQSPKQKTSRGNVKLLRISNRNYDKTSQQNKNPWEQIDEINQQQHPRLLRKQERMKNKNKTTANKKERKQYNEPFEGSGRQNTSSYFGTVSKNSSKKNNNGAKPPSFPVKNTGLLQQQNFLRNSNEGPLRLRPSNHIKRNTVFIQQSNDHHSVSSSMKSSQKLQNRSMLSNRLAKSRSPSHINQKLFKKSKPINPLFACGCNGKSQSRSSINLEQHVVQNHTVTKQMNYTQQTSSFDKVYDEFESSSELNNTNTYSKMYTESNANVRETVENERKETIFNLYEHDDSHNPTQSPQENQDHFQFMDKNEYYQEKNRMIVMHNSSPKFRMSTSRIDQRDLSHIEHDDDDDMPPVEQEYEQQIQNGHYHYQRKSSLMECDTGQQSVAAQNVMETVVGFSIDPKLSEQSSAPYVAENQLKFDSTQRNQRESPIKYNSLSQQIIDERKVSDDSNENVGDSLDSQRNYQNLSKQNQMQDNTKQSSNNQSMTSSNQNMIVRSPIKKKIGFKAQIQYGERLRQLESQHILLKESKQIFTNQIQDQNDSVRINDSQNQTEQQIYTDNNPLNSDLESKEEIQQETPQEIYQADTPIEQRESAIDIQNQSDAVNIQESQLESMRLTNPLYSQEQLRESQTQSYQNTTDAHNNMEKDDEMQSDNEIERGDSSQVQNSINQGRDAETQMQPDDHMRIDDESSVEYQEQIHKDAQTQMSNSITSQAQNKSQGIQSTLPIQKKDVETQMNSFQQTTESQKQSFNQQTDIQEQQQTEQIEEIEQIEKIVEIEQTNEEEFTEQQSQNQIDGYLQSGQGSESFNEQEQNQGVPNQYNQYTFMEKDDISVGQKTDNSNKGLQSQVFPSQMDIETNESLHLQDLGYDMFKQQNMQEQNDTVTKLQDNNWPQHDTYGMTQGNFGNGQYPNDRNQVNEVQGDQQQILPEQSTGSNGSLGSFKRNEEKINSSQVSQEIQKSSIKQPSELFQQRQFEYGVEDIKQADTSQILNLNITKTQDSPNRHDPTVAGMRVTEDLEQELDQESEIHQRKGSEGSGSHAGASAPAGDSSLMDVMQTFKENEKREKKNNGNFGWNKAVQHKVIRLKDIQEEAERLEHTGDQAKIDGRSAPSRMPPRLNMDMYKVTTSQETFQTRLQRIQHQTFGYKSLSKTRTARNNTNSPPNMFGLQNSCQQITENKVSQIDAYLARKQERQVAGMGLKQNQITSNAFSSIQVPKYSTNFNIHKQGIKTARSPKPPLIGKVKKFGPRGVAAKGTLGYLNGQQSLYAEVLEAKRQSKQRLATKPIGATKAKIVRRVAKKPVDRTQDMPFQLGKGPHDHLVCQGKLLRFRPGIEKDFVPRWVQLTRKDFRYFENGLRAENCLNAENLIRMAQYTGKPVTSNLRGGPTHTAAPLLSIPVGAILRAQRLKESGFEIQKNRNHGAQKPLYKNMFEIKLKCNYEDLHQYREEARANLDTVSRNSPHRSNQGSNHSRKSLGAKSLSSFYGSPIPKKRNMFERPRFPKSPHTNLVGKHSLNSFKRASAHRTNALGRDSSGKDLATAHACIRLDRSEKSKVQHKRMFGLDLGAGVAGSSGYLPESHKAIFNRSKSQLLLKNGKRDSKRALSNCALTHGDQQANRGGTKAVTGRGSFAGPQSSGNISRGSRSSKRNSHGSFVSQKSLRVTGMQGRKKSAAALLTKQRGGRGKSAAGVSEMSVKYAQIDLTSDMMNADCLSALGKKKQQAAGHLERSQSRKIHKVIRGQLMPMPQMEPKREHQGCNVGGSPARRGGSPECHSHHHQLSGGKDKSGDLVPESHMRQHSIVKDGNMPPTFAREGQGIYCKLADATNFAQTPQPCADQHRNRGASDGSPHQEQGEQRLRPKQNDKVIQICASNRSLGASRSRFDDESVQRSERNQQLWTQRQKLWCKEERRIVFTCQTQEQSNQWMNTLNKYIADFNKASHGLGNPVDYGTFGKKIQKKNQRTKSQTKTQNKQILSGLKQFKKQQQRQTGVVISKID